jgi:hypothetical protein
VFCFFCWFYMWSTFDVEMIATRWHTKGLGGKCKATDLPTFPFRQCRWQVIFRFLVRRDQHLLFAQSYSINMSWIPRVQPSLQIVNPFVILTGNSSSLYLSAISTLLIWRLELSVNEPFSALPRILFSFVLLLSHVVRCMVTIPSLDGTVQNGKGHLDSKIG